MRRNPHCLLNCVALALRSSLDDGSADANGKTSLKGDEHKARESRVISRMSRVVSAAEKGRFEFVRRDERQR